MPWSAPKPIPNPGSLEMLKPLPVARPGWHAFFWLSLSHNFRYLLLRGLSFYP